MFVFVLVMAAVACGEDVSPTKVGEVSDANTPIAEEPSEEQPQDTPQEEATAATQAPETYQVGDIIAIGDVVMAVLGWDSPEGDEFNKPEEGNRFVVVDALFVNQGSSAASISSLLQMTLKDDAGQRYNVDLMASTAAGASAPDGEISPGERVRGKIGFQVPAEATGLVFTFEPSFSDIGKVFVELGPEPVAMEPPAEIVGEVAGELYQVGDIIQIGDLEMVVNGVSYPPGDDFNKPEEGKQFIVVDVSITNKGQEAKAISSLLQMWVKDSTGQKYDVDLMATTASNGATPDGDVLVGETIRGQVGYQTPVDAGDLVFVFDADVFGAGKVQIALPATE